MPVPVYQVDAFADRPFVGNPAAVCLLDEPHDEGWMQLVAREMNLSETAFVVLRPDSETFGLRWFTPASEVELCGHATLATAHVLYESGRLPLTSAARFHTLSGILLATRAGEAIELDFPATPAEEAEPPPGLTEALGGVTPVWFGQSVFDYLVEVESEAVVRATQPDFGLLKRLPARGVMVTSRAEMDGYDFVSRFFAPVVGVDEDPVTGSAHCSLTPHWAERLGKDEMVAYQASPRGGTVLVSVAGDRVKLAGTAVTVLRGELTDPTAL